jgi:hypothetical protein
VSKHIFVKSKEYRKGMYVDLVVCMDIVQEEDKTGTEFTSLAFQHPCMEHIMAAFSAAL